MSVPKYLECMKSKEIATADNPGKSWKKGQADFFSHMCKSCGFHWELIHCAVKRQSFQVIGDASPVRLHNEQGPLLEE